MPIRLALALALALAVTACTADESGGATGAACPTADAPTYDSFGRDFMAKYCTACHSTAAQQRFGAPGNLNFDSEADIKKFAGEIDREAAKGPRSTNTGMPDLGGAVKTEPSADEREKLGQFLACMQK